MTAYAVADLHSVRMGPAIIEYLERIDATLAPFGGRYIIHGGRKAVLEGDWPGDLIVIAFPDRAAAAAWYDSPAYRAIKNLRTDHCEGVCLALCAIASSLSPATIIAVPARSEEHTSELQSLMRISYAVFCLKKKKNKTILSQLKTQH